MAYGTEKQSEYLKRLAHELGYDTVAKALADLTDFGAAQELSVEQASQAIEALKVATGKPAGGDKDKPRFLTARHLRQMALGERAAPGSLDDDALWVLERLRYAVALGALAASDVSVARRAPADGVNHRGPIEMAQLLEFFGSWDALAEAFGVAVPTARAWGTHLPAPRAFQAEVRTQGHFRAPL